MTTRKERLRKKLERTYLDALPELDLALSKLVSQPSDDFVSRRQFQLYLEKAAADLVDSTVARLKLQPTAEKMKEFRGKVHAILDEYCASKIWSEP